MKPAATRAHRRPPLPHWDKGQGFCRWCGEACQPTRQWHSPCVAAYKIAYWGSEARKAVLARDKGVCALCGVNAERAFKEARAAELSTQRGLYRRVTVASGDFWQADHITPLVEANRDDLSLWGLQNLRLLCTACHKAETKALAGRRAASRKTTITIL